MNKIIDTKQATTLCRKLRDEGKTIVLAGGCFDILHTAHIAFLQKAKQEGDVLIVLLESDESIRNAKGEHRPINIQKDRAEVLAALEVVDYIVLLPYFRTYTYYDELILGLKPHIIATTKGDPHIRHKKRQADKLNARLVEVIERIAKKSTSKLAKLILTEYYL